MQLDDLKILICDDSILARKQMKDIINSIGSPTIIEAANGQLAIDMYTCGAIAGIDRYIVKGVILSVKDLGKVM